MIIASGPSLEVSQIDYLTDFVGLKTIAINECGLRRYMPLAVPWADMLYAADAKWWRDHRPAFRGMLVSGEEVTEVSINNQVWPAIETTVLKCIDRTHPMPREPGTVVGGGHSGFQALGLALTLGASRIVLLGYDCTSKPGRNCHVDRPKRYQNSPAFDRWIEMYRRVPAQWPDVEVINCSRHTQIDAFPVREITEVLT